MLHMVFGLGFLAVAYGIVQALQTLDDVLGLRKGWKYVVAWIVYIVGFVLGLWGVFLFVGGLVDTGLDLWRWIECLTSACR